MSAQTGGVPPLSIVVVVLAGRDYLVRCLEALEKQQGIEPPEIIVPHDATLLGIPALQSRFRNVRFIGHEGRKTFAELRAAGVGAAGGDVVAVTEDHCSAEPTWAQSILELHRGPWAAVGGPVDKSGRDSMLNWAIYLSDFGRYMNPVAEGPVGYLTDVNVTYKRASLEATSQLWQNEFHETTVNWALQDQGKQLLLSRRVAVRQQRSLELGYALGERYRFGRLFASTRVAGAGLGKRLFYSAASAVLPAILLARVYRNVFSKRRFDTPFLRIVPVLVLLNLVWAWGEVMGYLTGRAVPALRPDAAAPGAPGAPQRVAGEPAVAAR
ncbi:MAG TPA: glycosyltransferase [Longimicrobiales bacterium]